MTGVPSAWAMEQAMSALMSGRAAMEADLDLACDEAAIMGALSVETQDVMEMIHAVLRASVEARASAEAVDTMLRDLTARRDRYRKRGDTLRATAFAAMDALGLPRAEWPDLTASIARGRPTAIVTDEAALPAEYTRTTVTPDKAAINEAIKQGVVTPGVEVTNAIPTLQVRTK